MNEAEKLCYVVKGPKEETSWLGWGPVRLCWSVLGHLPHLAKSWNSGLAMAVCLFFFGGGV